MIDRMSLEEVVKDKLTVIKMHLGCGTGFSTIHPLFVKILADKLKSYGAKVLLRIRTSKKQKAGVIPKII
jgi:uncharacterized protein